MARRRPPTLKTGLLLLSLGCGVAFAVVARAVARGRTRSVDRKVREAVVAVRSDALDAVSAVVTAMTAPALLVALTCTAAGLLVRKRSLRVWLPIAASPWIAMSAGASFTCLLPQQYSPDRKESCEPCFPSGHTTGLTTEALTFAIVARRHGLIGRGAFAALLALPVVGGVNRLYRDRHWASDIAGSWIAGLALAALLCAVE
jgi:membrane-associated phospholipid phosphatase